MFFEWLDRVLKTDRLLPVMGIIGALAYIFWAMNPSPIPKQLADNGANAGNTQLLPKPPLRDSENPATLLRDQQILAREKIEKERNQAPFGNLADRSSELSTELTFLKTAFENWGVRLSELSLNDSGRKIVSNVTILPDVIAIVEGQDKFRTEFFSLTNEGIEVGKRAIEAIRSSKDGATSKEISNTIQGTIDRVQRMRREIEKLDKDLSSLEKSSANLKPAGKTLAVAIQDRKKAETLAAERELESARERIRLENLARDKQAAIEKERQEIQRRQALLLAEQRLFKPESEGAKVRPTRATLLAEFNRDLPQIKHYLGKLFMIGYTQPTSCQNFEKVGKEGPVSYSQIVAVGALNEDPEGSEKTLSSLLQLMNARNNDRKLAGPYPEYAGGTISTQEAAAIRPAYVLLNKYGRLLVEKGYLQE